MKGLTFSECQMEIVKHGAMPTISGIVDSWDAGILEDEKAVCLIKDVINFYDVVVSKNEKN